MGGAMELDDDEWALDLEAVRTQVRAGNYAVRPHAMQHAVKEGFSVDDMIHVILHGMVVEEYPQRQRGLLYADVIVEGIVLPLHVVCEHRHLDAPVDLVTAYVPDTKEWETPTRRRRKRR